MKFRYLCHTCFKKNPDLQNKLVDLVAFNESGIYHHRCNYGHDNIICVQAFNFEILFESGLCAIYSDFYLESVLSITAAIERFYVFFIRILLKSRKIKTDEYEKMYNNMSKQSERQLGAFLCLYSFFYKECPPILLSSKSVEFRNKVVHKGFLPTKEEVLKYAENVYDIIKFYNIKLREDFQDEIQEYGFETNAQIVNQITAEEWKEIPVVYSSTEFAFSQIRELESYKKETFNERFKLLRKMNFYF